MRLDKFLKVSRLIKRRTLANEACDQGKVSINGRVAKAGTPVTPGDEIALDFGYRLLRVQVSEEINNPKQQKADLFYRLLEEKRVAKESEEDR